MIPNIYAPTENDLRFDAHLEADIQLARPGWATFSLFCRNIHTGKCFQRSYPIQELHLRIEEYNHYPDHDVYIVQNLFNKYNRRSLTLKSLCSCYVDLDLYHLDENKPAEAWVEDILEHCWREDIPKPSAIICSGRGIYLKYYLKNGAMASALPKWDRMQLELVNRFEDFAVDRKARDASRLFRLMHSVNSKSGRRVETLWLNGSPEDVRRYSLRELGDAILPYTDAQIQEFRRQSKVKEALYNYKKIHKKKGFIELRGSDEWSSVLWATQLSFAMRGRHVFDDLWLLARLRGWDKAGIPDGERMNFVLWLCNHAALALNGAEQPRVYMEVSCFLKQLIPHWSMQKIHDGLHSVYKRSKAMMEPQGWLEYQGKLYPALYTPSNQFLIEALKITDKELDSLNYIRDKDSYARQKKKERREQGVISRDEYISQSDNRKILALELRLEGISISEIAKILKVSKRTISNYLNKR